MDSILLKEISEKLDKLIAVTATQGKERDDQIKILTSLGFTNQEISNLTSIPKGTVDGVRAKLEKEKNCRKNRRSN